MKDFRSYKNASGGNSGDSGDSGNGGNASSGADYQFEGQAAELTKKALEAWSGKSEGMVLLEILRQAEAGKRAGTLTNADLDGFYAQFSPMLNDGQREKLKSIIDKLKKI